MTLTWPSFAWCFAWSKSPIPHKPLVCVIENKLTAHICRLFIHNSLYICVVVFFVFFLKSKDCIYNLSLKFVNINTNTIV